MTTELENIIDVARRLDAKRDVPPARLPLQRDRDGGREEHVPMPSPKRSAMFRNVAPVRSWDWRSKQP